MDSWTQKAPESAKQKQTHAKLVKSARNPPEIGCLPEIFFARQTARRLSNPPEFYKSGGENRHLATLEFHIKHRRVEIYLYDDSYPYSLG
jgi:hypothetical protein